VTLSLLFPFFYSYLLHFLSFSHAIIHCSPPTTFCPSSCIFSQCLCLPFYPSLTCYHTTPPAAHSPSIDKPTVPTVHTPRPCNPWHKHRPPQQWKYTQNTQGPQKPAASISSAPPTQVPPFAPPLVPPLPITQVSISSQLAITSSTTTVHRYYGQEVFDIICKQMV
jgi:hypothetical protein